MSVLVCCPQILVFTLSSFIFLPISVFFLSRRVSRVAVLSTLSFYVCFSLLPWVISFALYFLHLPPNFSVHMKPEDFIYCCLQEFCVIPSYLPVLFYFFSSVSLISVGLSCFDIHFLVFLSVVVILSWFASLCWLFTLSLYSCCSLLPLFCLVFPLTSFILLSLEIFLKAKFFKSLPVFVGIACLALNL